MCPQYRDQDNTQFTQYINQIFLSFRECSHFKNFTKWLTLLISWTATNWILYNYCNITVSTPCYAMCFDGACSNLALVRIVKFMFKTDMLVLCMQVMDHGCNCYCASTCSQAIELQFCLMLSQFLAKNNYIDEKFKLQLNNY